MKYVWLIRHAKSSWADAGQDDFSRQLAPRGHSDGALIAAWLALHSTRVEWLHTSTAARAAATADFVQQAFDIPGSARNNERRLYLAAPETIVDVLQSTPADIGCAAVVGHNPGISQTLGVLTNYANTWEFPTLGCALVGCDVDDWFDLGMTGNELLQTQRPKNLRGSQ